MKRVVTCIECPEGCRIEAEVSECRVYKVSGHKCPKGEEYAIKEVENPVRILTSTVLAKGLSSKMVPVRTDRPMPKGKLMEAMGVLKKIRIDVPVRIGDILIKDLLGTGVNLISTRSVE